MTFARDRQGLWGDAVAALILCLILSIAWAVHDWSALSALVLPDTDDVMRLQQIRDWIDGQRFADLSQHRLGATPGLAMHWSRLPDLVPGAIIAALTSLFGRHASEIIAVIAWPAMLLGMALFLTARIARALGGAEIARTALVVAALAYPSSAIFLPGRIDHHGLQVVLLLAIVHALLARRGMMQGAVAGLAAAASIAIGLETLPLLVVAGAVIVVRWIDRGSNAPLLGFGLALAIGLFVARLALHADQFGYPACDGFTAISWRVAELASFLPIGLAGAGYVVSRRDVRAALAVLVAGIAVLGVWRFAPMCLSPYGAVDPLLAKLWLSNVGEAQPLLRARPEMILGHAGLMLVGIAASLWRVRVTRSGDWLTLLAFQLAALALTCVQLRGAYAGAILAAPALAAMIAAARPRGTLALAAAWIGSAGMLYPLAASALAPAEPSVAGPSNTTGSCTDPQALARLAPLEGRLIAPLDLGAYAVGASKLSVVGAPYHRNNDGNAAVYRFFLGSPEGARRIAAHWQLRYVALCGGSFGEIGKPSPKTLLGQLRAGRAPGWMRRIEASRDDLTLFSIEPRLLVAPAKR
ncbi:hypothetical protein [Sphingomonas sp. PB4P5]|uniref:hypothetical protein n=1 Tax=Parasphingomonas puruogangriensis TaxID=3096155 RepID=UPI002FCB79AF